MDGINMVGTHAEEITQWLREPEELRSVSYFSHCYNKMLEKYNLKKGVLLAV